MFLMKYLCCIQIFIFYALWRNEVEIQEKWLTGVY